MLEIWNALHQFFILNGYVLELFLAVVLFVFSAEKRKYFIVRLLWSMTVIIAFSAVWSVFFPQSSLSQVIKFVILFVLFTSGICFTMKIGLWGGLFNIGGAVATQHIAFKTFSIIISLTGLTYDSNIAVPINFAVIAAVYAIMYFAFVRNMRRMHDEYNDRKPVIMTSLLLVIFAFVLHCFIESYVGLDNVIPFVIVALYGIACAVFTLGMLRGFSLNDVLVHDMETMEHLLHIQEEQYKTSKENMDIINIKCHDMKQQIFALESRIDRTALREINEAINIYDTNIKTGNEVLDAFIAEKKLICDKERIKFDCLADGNSIAFMRPADIYSLFGNAIDNAIEAVKLLDEDKRVINLSVKKNMNMVSVHVVNFFDGTLQFDGDLPRTTKNNTKYHGFGMRSIKMIVEKYGGNIAIVVNDGMFNLNVLMPIRAASAL